MFDGFIKNQLNHKLTPYGLTVTAYSAGKITIQVQDAPARLQKIDKLVKELGTDENVHTIDFDKATALIHITFNPSVATNLSALNQWLQIIDTELR